MNYVSLGDCCEIISGSTPSRNNEKYWDGNINWFTPKDLSKIEGRFVFGSPEKITEEGLNQSSARLILPNSLLFSSRAPIGHIAINKEIACTNQGFKNLVPNPELDVNYLYYVMKQATPELKELGQGAIFKELSKSILSKYKIPLPPLPIQKKIAEVLDKADAIRQRNRQILEKYDQLAESLFFEMFGDPVRNEKGWPKAKLGELGIWHSGGTPSRKNKDYFIGDIPWVASGELNNIFISNSAEKISKKAIYETSAKLVDPGSLLIGMYDTAAFKSSINIIELSCNQAIAFSKLDEGISNTLFVYYNIQLVKNYYKKLQRGIRQKNLNLSIVKGIEIIFPDINLQRKFGNSLIMVLEKKSDFQKEFQYSENLFQSLLQKAFKGELFPEEVLTH